jgi:hypothetical protein
MAQCEVPRVRNSHSIEYSYAARPNEPRLQGRRWQKRGSLAVIALEQD